MFMARKCDSILAADPKLYVAAEVYPGFGTFVEGIGYNLNGNGVIGITDGTATNFFPNGFADRRNGKYRRGAAVKSW